MKNKKASKRAVSRISSKPKWVKEVEQLHTDGGFLLSNPKEISDSTSITSELITQILLGTVRINQDSITPIAMAQTTLAIMCWMRVAMDCLNNLNTLEVVLKNYNTIRFIDWSFHGRDLYPHIKCPVVFSFELSSSDRYIISRRSGFIINLIPKIVQGQEIILTRSGTYLWSYIARFQKNQTTEDTVNFNVQKSTFEELTVQMLEDIFRKSPGVWREIRNLLLGKLKQELVELERNANKLNDAVGKIEGLVSRVGTE